MLNQIKELQLDKYDLDELVVMSAFGKGLAVEFLAHKLEPPEWLETRLHELTKEIASKSADYRAKRIKEIRNKLQSLRTAEERRNDLQKELERLQNV